MKYPCGEPGHAGILAQIEGQLTLVGDNFPTPIYTEFRVCGCVTWRRVNS